MAAFLFCFCLFHPLLLIFCCFLLDLKLIYRLLLILWITFLLLSFPFLFLSVLASFDCSGSGSCLFLTQLLYVTSSSSSSSTDSSPSIVFWHPLYPKYCSLIGHLEQNALAVWNMKWKGLWEKKMIYPSQTQTVRWNEETEPFPKINLIWMIDFCGVSYLLGICSNPTLIMINVDCQAPKPLVPKTPNQVPIRSKTKRDWAGWGWHLNAVGQHRPLPPPPPM